MPKAVLAKQYPDRLEKPSRYLSSVYVNSVAKWMFASAVVSPRATLRVLEFAKSLSQVVGGFQRGNHRRPLGKPLSHTVV